MSKTPVYVIANLLVKDPSTYREYEKGFFPILKRHEGTFLTYDDNALTFEGANPPKGRMIIFMFPSEANAKSWYKDPDYQALSEHRRDATKLEFLTMIHGLPPRS